MDDRDHKAMNEILSRRLLAKIAGNGLQLTEGGDLTEKSKLKAEIYE